MIRIGLLALLTVGFLLLPCNAAVLVFIDIAHDDLELRETYLPHQERSERETAIDRLQRMLVKGIHTRQELAREVGDSYKPQRESLARPLGGAPVVGPENW